MEKLKIAFTQGSAGEAVSQTILAALNDPAMTDLCTPMHMDEQEAVRNLGEGKANALVLGPSGNPAPCPADAFELIVMDKTCIAQLTKEPTAADVGRLAAVLERDFDRRSPRIAIVQDSNMQNPDLTNQVTTEQGINTYGPYTTEQIAEADMAQHFDGIIATSPSTAKLLAEEHAETAPVRYFAGRHTIVMAMCQPKQVTQEDGLADLSWLTHPFYLATDIARHRANYDQARQNPLPKLFRDKREDRRKDESNRPNNNEKPEEAS